MSQFTRRARRALIRRLVRLLDESDLRPAATEPNNAGGNPRACEHTGWKNHIRHDAMLQFFQLRGLECRVAFDVGAYQGDWSRWLRKRFPDAHLYLFEPLKEQHEVLERLRTELGECTLIPHGLSRQPEAREITVWPSLSGSSVLPQRGQRWDHLEKRSIALESINHLLAEGQVRPPDIVKLDVQGHELAVLEGATSILGQTQVFVIECSLHRYFGDQQPLAWEIWDWMRAHGYELFDICGTYRRPVDHALDQFDMVYLHRDHRLHAPGPLSAPHEFDW